MHSRARDSSAKFMSRVFWLRGLRPWTHQLGLQTVSTLPPNLWLLETPLFLRHSVERTARFIFCATLIEYIIVYTSVNRRRITKNDSQPVSYRTSTKLTTLQPKLQVNSAWPTLRG